MTVVDSLPIDGMKKSDFERLAIIFENYQEEPFYYGREDYWNESMERLEAWLFAINVYLKDAKIKEKQ